MIKRTSTVVVLLVLVIAGQAQDEFTTDARVFIELLVSKRSTTVIFGVPASYWLDLRGYDPAESAKTLKQPMLILQGERDYQVTMEDFKRWNTVLAGKGNVTFKSYPGLNHLFIAGTNRSTPLEYEQPGHVDVRVVEDIASWIKKH